MTKVETTASVPKAQLSTLKVNVIPRINYVLRKKKKKPLKAVESIFKEENKEISSLQVFIGGERLRLILFILFSFF